jgi:hypothetical protein
MALAALRLWDRKQAAEQAALKLQLESLGRSDVSPYLRDPVAYAREVLHVEPWQKQREVMEDLLKPPYRIWVRSCHNVGKTHLAALVVNWFYDTFRDSCAILTTAPTERDIIDLLWREIRVMRGRAGLGGFVGPKEPTLYDHPDHYAKGFPSKNFFVGRHVKHMLFVLDEAPGCEGNLLTQLNTMFKPDGHMMLLAIGNPVDTASQMYVEEMAVDLDGAPKWKTIAMSAVDHPNIVNALQGLEPEIPLAVTLAQFQTWLADWSDPVLPEEADALDLEWPPGSGQFFRPGPEMEARALGRWPTVGSDSVWSEAAWNVALTRQELPPPTVFPEIGCDVARKGRNKTAIVVRVGNCALHYEDHQGWEGPRTVGRLKELAQEWAAWATKRLPPQTEPIKPYQIQVKVDEDGMGGLGVVDWANPAWRQDFNFVPVSAGGKATDEERYVNCRSEMWFEGVIRARTRRMDLSRLPKDVLSRLRVQAMAPLWDFVGSRRAVEPKKHMEERLPSLGSPDGMDGINLAFRTTTDANPKYIPVEEPVVKESRAEARGLFGRRS